MQEKKRHAAERGEPRARMYKSQVCNLAAAFHTPAQVVSGAAPPGSRPQSRTLPSAESKTGGPEDAAAFDSGPAWRLEQRRQRVRPQLWGTKSAAVWKAAAAKKRLSSNFAPGAAENPRAGSHAQLLTKGSNGRASAGGDNALRENSLAARL